MKKTVVQRLRSAIRQNHVVKLIRNVRINCRTAYIRSSYLHKRIDDIAMFEQCFYSQNGEDGIFRMIFDKIKTTNRFCIEFGIHANEGNTILLRKQGWTCLWMDGNGDGEIVKKEMITAENINGLFEKYNVPREPDLLSIDIDGNDYWVWKAIHGYSPRVVVMEYNASIPPTESRTIAYDPTHTWDDTSYFGASLLALYSLAKTKGYTLIGCNSHGVNAFFIRNDLVGDHFAVKPVEELYRPPGFGKKVDGKFIGHTKSSKELVFLE